MHGILDTGGDGVTEDPLAPGAMDLPGSGSVLGDAMLPAMLLVHEGFGWVLAVAREGVGGRGRPLSGMIPGLAKGASSEL